MSLPDAWEGVLLALAAWRVWHLIAEDTILDKPRRYITRLGDWEEEGDDYPEDHRFGLREFIECPFCMGFWVSLLITIAWAVFPTETLWVSVPLALNSVVVAVNYWLSSD